MSNQLDCDSSSGTYRSGRRCMRFLAIIWIVLLIQSPATYIYASPELPASASASQVPPAAATGGAAIQNGVNVPIAFQGVWAGSLTLGPDDTLQVLMTLTPGSVNNVVGMIAFNGAAGGCVEAIQLQAVNNTSINLKTDVASGAYFGECLASNYRLTLSADGTLLYEEFINNLQRTSTNLTRINAADTTTHAALSGVWRGAVLIDSEPVPVVLALANGSPGNIAGTIAFDGDSLCIEAMELQASTSETADLTTAIFAGTCVPSLYQLRLEADGTLSYTASVNGIPSGTGSLTSVGISFAITGRITDANKLPVADTIIYDDAGHTAISLRDGTYALTGLAPGQYTLVPFKSGQTFTPESLLVTVPPDSTDQNFTIGTVSTTARTIDVTMSLYDTPTTPAARDPYEQVIGFFADGVFEASNGAHKLGRVTVYTGGAYANRAHILWDPQRCRAYARISGYGREQDGAHVMMCGPPDWRGYAAAGYVLAHEWGHYYYSLYDEYREEGRLCDYLLNPSQPCNDDTPVANSIMHNQYQAVDGDYNWLNFSTARNNTRNNAQYRMYGASAWETLARSPALDPRSGYLRAAPERLYYPELADVAPAPGQNPVIDLAANHTARDQLTITWGSGFSAGAAVPDDRLALMATDVAASIPFAQAAQANAGTAHLLAIDISAGMVADNKLEDVKRAAQWLVDQAVIGQDAFGIITFDDEITIVQPITLLDSNETRALLKQQLDSIQPGRIDAAIGTAVQQAVQEMQRFAATTNSPAENRHIYLLTGSPSRQGIPPLAVLNEVTAAGLSLHTIGYGVDPTTARVLETVAGETRGTYHFIPAPTDNTHDKTLADLIVALEDMQQFSDAIVTTDITIGTLQLPAAANITLPIIVDSTLDTLELTVTFPTATPAELHLNDPAGTPADAATCTAVGSVTTCVFRVRTPLLHVGSWTLQATAGATPVTLEYRATGQVQGKPTFTASVELLNGETITYPDPLVVRALLQKALPIAGAIVTATVILPDGTVQPVSLHNDGTAPDQVAADGAYSAILDYTQNGTYLINVQFDNSAGVAEETNRGVAFAPDDGQTVIPDPTPVGENFMRVAQTHVQVTGVRADDHGDTPPTATHLFADNTDIPGRIDRPGDKDVFTLTASSDGQIVVRISGLALGMEPVLRLLAADGTTMLEEVTFAPDKQDYMYTLQAVKAGEVRYAEVSHLDGTATSGHYTVSAGPALSRERPTLPWSLIGTIIASSVLLIGATGTYLLTRRPRRLPSGSPADEASATVPSRSGKARRRPLDAPDGDAGATTKDKRS